MRIGTPAFFTIGDLRALGALRTFGELAFFSTAELFLALALAAGAALAAALALAGVADFFTGAVFLAAAAFFGFAAAAVSFTAFDLVATFFDLPASVASLATFGFLAEGAVFLAGLAAPARLVTRNDPLAPWPLVCMMAPVVTAVTSALRMRLAWVMVSTPKVSYRYFLIAWLEMPLRRAGPTSLAFVSHLERRGGPTSAVCRTDK
ncbi:hypothetical protein TYRP_002371 [Tyrophagus putrescentiae]|nr:hypothetical protein TYRP_002371 [Tyrophagus putrescentiae]